MFLVHQPNHQNQNQLKSKTKMSCLFLFVNISNGKTHGSSYIYIFLGQKKE